MGPCNSTDWVECLYEKSYYSPIYLFPEFELPSLGGDPSTLTLSGNSGGANVASIMHTIYSKEVKGVGLMLGGPYGDDMT